MKLEDGYCKMQSEDIFNRAVSGIFTPDSLPVNVQGKYSKGKYGQNLEKWIGISPGNSKLDFEDGDLKTYHSHQNYKPIESIKINKLEQKSKDEFIDNFLEEVPKPFEETALAKKIENVLLVPRVDSKEKAFFLNCFHIRPLETQPLFEQLKEDYYNICSQMRNWVEKYEPEKNVGFIHTSNGKYLQVRTSDQGKHKDTPIWSKSYNRFVQSKQMAFFFRTEFSRDIVRGKIKVEKMAKQIQGADWI